MRIKESYYRSVLRHFLKYPSGQLKNMNEDECQEEYEKIVSNSICIERF
ncbi:hypothetical protein P4678_22330 [Priestia megaterium]|nr:hypothetical protein [Priestia megaterium]